MSIIDDRVAPVLGLAAHLGRGMRRIGTDAAIGRLRRTPRTVADLDAPALSRLIGRPVASVEVIDGDETHVTRLRLHAPDQAATPG